MTFQFVMRRALSFLRQFVILGELFLVDHCKCFGLKGLGLLVMVLGLGYPRRFLIAIPCVWCHVPHALGFRNWPSAVACMCKVLEMHGFLNWPLASARMWESYPCLVSCHAFSWPCVRKGVSSEPSVPKEAIMPLELYTAGLNNFEIAFGKRHGRVHQFLKRPEWRASRALDRG
eukprot:5218263-Amphidinium_carterae.1